MDAPKLNFVGFYFCLTVDNGNARACVLLVGGAVETNIYDDDIGGCP